jgi:CheY-like chemotaxis protein
MDEQSAKSTPHVILLVEPNRSIASLVSSLLSRQGYEILAANTCEEAVELCSGIAGIDLIITDDFSAGCEWH